MYVLSLFLIFRSIFLIYLWLLVIESRLELFSVRVLDKYFYIFSFSPWISIGSEFIEINGLNGLALFMFLLFDREFIEPNDLFDNYISFEYLLLPLKFKVVMGEVEIVWQ